MCYFQAKEAYYIADFHKLICSFEGQKEANCDLLSNFAMKIRNNPSDVLFPNRFRLLRSNYQRISLLFANKQSFTKVPESNTL